VIGLAGFQRDGDRLLGGALRLTHGDVLLSVIVRKDPWEADPASRRRSSAACTRAARAKWIGVQR
jgi:hypothetical protein